MSYLSDFEELNGGYVAFGGNPNGGKIFGKGKFQGKVDEGFLVGYSVCSKAFRVFNSRTRIIQETLHVNFLENKSNVVGTGPTCAQSKEQDDQTNKEAKGNSPVESVTGYRDLNTEFQDCSENSTNEVTTTSSTVPTVGQNSLNITNTFSAAGLSNTVVIPTYGKTSDIDASKVPDDPDMLGLEDIIYSNDEDVVVDLPYGKRAIGTKWVYRNKKDKRGIVIRNKLRLVAQGHTQEEGIDYEEVFAQVARIEAIRLFLAYASFMGFMVYQMD
nr:hypothetical protein [Tanacetum cinerariifolium]